MSTLGLIRNLVVIFLMGLCCSPAGGPGSQSPVNVDYTYEFYINPEDESEDLRLVTEEAIFYITTTHCFDMWVLPKNQKSSSGIEISVIDLDNAEGVDKNIDGRANNDNGVRTIEIDQEIDLSSDRAIVVMIHEMTHHLTNFGHDTKVGEKHIPVGLMDESATSDEYTQADSVYLCSTGKCRCFQ